VSAIKVADGKIAEMIGIARDITENKQAHQALQQSEALLREKAQQLEQALQELRQTQSQLIHTEKMSSLGQLVAGVAHEINNPVTFIYGNLAPANEYIQDLLQLLRLYQDHYPHAVPEIQAETEAIDLDFLMEDLPKMLSSMQMGADRIREIVLSLRNFSRLDEAEIKPVDLHEGLNNTLLILQSRLKSKGGQPEIQVIKEYGTLPKVECYAGQINQVFMNILTNAIDALEEYNKKRSLKEIKQNPSQIRISTQLGNAITNGSQVEKEWVTIRIADNGMGMTPEVKERLFDPFFTTKPVGQGTGLGLSISYQIVVDKHGGQLWCESAPGLGAQFVIKIPIFYRQKSDPVTSDH
jgi:signal transduction histidine kinase